tara:strand:+ start:1606 stop:2070 length:465 start_codon:yes stop_codon:yes gene_type:complete
MKTERIDLKFTVSKGQETYGWNICSLYSNNVKQNQNCGCGYDMQGTALADYIEENYQDRLLKMHRRIKSAYSVKMLFTPKCKGNKYRRLKDRKGGFYGGTAYYYKGQKTPFKISLDGGCGFNSIERICNAIGLKLHYTGQTKNKTSYILEDKRA